MKGIRITAWVVVTVMAVAIIYGFSSGDFGDEASAIWALPWGKVSIIDLYAGLVIFGAWVAVRERSLGKVALWWVGLIVLGNFAAGAYVVRSSLNSADLPELLLGERGLR